MSSRWRPPKSSREINIRICCAGAASVLIALFCICVSLKLNGSSVGMWSVLLQEHSRPRGLLFSTPKLLRIDEWGIWTPAMLSQARQVPPFPIENPNLGAGRAPLIMNVPVAYYTTFFRPQLWGFFLFDFERGFSFYWCCKVFGLLLATGWCLRVIGLRSRALVLIGTMWIFLSSFTQWWFSSPAMLPELVASWAVCVGCAAQFFKAAIWWRKVCAFFVFVFFGINFVLCLYPPFQIPLCWLGVVFLIGLWYTNHKGSSRCAWIALARNGARRHCSHPCSVLVRCSRHARYRGEHGLSRQAAQPWRRSVVLENFFRGNRFLPNRAGSTARLRQHLRSKQFLSALGSRCRRHFCCARAP